MDRKFWNQFPRDPAGRFIVGYSAALPGLLCGWAYFGLRQDAAPNESLVVWFLRSTVEAAALALTVYYVSRLIWAIAMPRWLEWISEHIVNHMLVALWVFFGCTVFACMFLKLR